MKQISTQHINVNSGNLTAGRNVTSEHHTQMMHTRHGDHARQGARVIGQNYEPYWITDSATNVVIGDTGKSIASMAMPFTLERSFGTLITQKVALTLWVYGRSFEITVEIYTVDAQSLVHTFVISRAAITDDWVSSTMTINEIAARQGSVLVNDFRLFAVKVRARRFGPVDARINQIALMSKRLIVADV